MDASAYGWIEIILVFGGALAFLAWQWLDIRRLRRDRERARQDEAKR